MTPPELLQRFRQADIPVSPAGLVRPAALARFLDVHEQTLKNWRDAAKPPRWIRLNGSFYYELAAIAEFLAGDEGP